MNRSRLFWFANGAMFGVLIFAAANAISYFVRSRGWTQLIRPPTAGEEALGFPLEIWRSGKTYGGAFIDQAAASSNTMVAVAFGFIAGVTGAIKSNWLNRFLEAMVESERSATGNKMQFSLRGMLIMTSVAAVVAALARQAIGPRPELLAVIYLLGPLFLILIAMIPRNLNWQSRILLLIPSTIMLVVFAAYVGRKLNVEFDRVMMAIYLCWVPQTVLAAVCLTMAQGIKYSRGRQSDL